jgi:hypothetical protein
MNFFPTLLMDIPKDIIPQILSNLSVVDLIRYERVSKQWQSYIHNLVRRGDKMTSQKKKVLKMQWKFCKIFTKPTPNGVLGFTIWYNSVGLDDIISVLSNRQNINILAVLGEISLIHHNNMICITSRNGSPYQFPSVPSSEYAFSPYSVIRTFTKLRNIRAQN